MSWSFPNSDTYAECGVGALPQNGSPLSVCWLIRPSVGDFLGVYLGIDPGDRIGLNAVVGSYFTSSDGTGGPSPVAGAWQIIGYDDDNSHGGTVRWHLCNLDGTRTWAHRDGTSGGNRSGVVTALRLGIGPGGFRMRGNVAAGFLAAGRLGDAGFEALSLVDMADWVSKADLAWQCNVPVGATALVDLTGGGADQTSLVGTPTLDTGVEPPGWSYFTGSTEATLDAAAAPATITISATAASSAALSATAAPATLTASTTASSAAALAATASPAQLTVAASSQAAAALTAVAAAATLSIAGSSGGTVVPRPSTGTVARPDDGLIHVPVRNYP